MRVESEAPGRTKGGDRVTDLLQTTGVAVTCEAVKGDLPMRTLGPRRGALLDFFAEVEGIARGRHGPLKPQGKGNPGGKPCQPKD